MTITFTVLAFRQNDWWIAQGLEYDIAACGRYHEEVTKHFERTFVDQLLLRTKRDENGDVDFGIPLTPRRYFDLYAERCHDFMGHGPQKMEREIQGRWWRGVDFWYAMKFLDEDLTRWMTERSDPLRVPVSVPLMGSSLWGKGKSWHQTVTGVERSEEGEVVFHGDTLSLQKGTTVLPVGTLVLSYGEEEVGEGKSCPSVALVRADRDDWKAHRIATVTGASWAEDLERPVRKALLEKTSETVRTLSDIYLTKQGKEQENAEPCVCGVRSYSR